MAQVSPMPWLDLFFLAYNKRELHRPVEYFHAHDGIEFLYIHEGTGQLVLNDRFYRIEPPTLIFYQPYQLHFLHMDFPYTRSILKMRLPLDDRFARLFPSLCHFLSDLVHHEPEQQVFRLEEGQDAELREQFRLFHETLTLSPKGERKEIFYSYCPSFLSYFKTRIYPMRQPAGQAFHPRATRHIEKVMKWIEEHFNEQFHLNELADEVHLSPSYLSRLFRKYTGSTLMEYISKRRLEEACLLLRTSHCTIGQVAQTSGFADTAYFCRSFKKRYGATPLQYRSAHG